MFADASQEDEALRSKWTDQLVMVTEERPELQRFAGIVGRVITVNFNKKAVIDFQDGGWYDITASERFLRILEGDEKAKAKFDSTANSAQAFPAKQS